METKAIPNKYKIIAYILLALTVVFTVFQTLLVFYLYDTDMYLYANGTLLPVIFNISLAVFVIITLCIFTFAKKNSFPDDIAPASSVTVLFSAISGFVLAVMSIYGLINLINARNQLFYIPSKQDNFLMIASVIGIVGFLYFVVTAFVPKGKNKLKAFLGCVVIIWHVIYLLSVYFDMTNPLNNPIRLMNEFALVGAMMYITSEVRFLLDFPKKGFYIGASIVAITLLSVSSVSNIVCTLLGKMAFDQGFFCYVYQITLVFYILSRLICYLKQKQEVLPEETPEEIPAEVTEE